MKKILALIALVLTIVSSYGQTNTEVLRNQPYVYSVTPGSASYNFHWSATGGTSTVIITVNNDSVNITWDGTLNSINTLSVYAEDKVSLCKGNIKSKQFKIVNALSYNGSVGSFANSCPKTATNPTGGNDASFLITVTATPAVTGTETVTVQYTIQGEGTGTATFAAGLSSETVYLNSKNYSNTTGSDIVKTVEITGLQISGRDAVSYPVGARPQGTFTISASPEISEIQF